jgi:hypothetical protein
MRPLGLEPRTYGLKVRCAIFLLYRQLRGYLEIKHWKIKGSAFSIFGEFIKKPVFSEKCHFLETKIP